MPESMNVTGQAADQTLRPVIEAFYAALIARDGDLVGRIVEQHFAQDVVLHRPESLPGGGRTAGVGRVKRALVAAATMVGGPLDVASMRVERVVEDRVVVVELAFEFDGQATGALELWSVDDLEVRSIRAFYWDTASMLAGGGAGR